MDNESIFPAEGVERTVNLLFDSATEMKSHVSAERSKYLTSIYLPKTCTIITIAQNPST